MQLLDAQGTRHVADGAARIVSLVPSITELLCELGLAPRLVGRTGFCIHPAELVAAMRPGSIYASVGRGNTTDEPALIRLLQAGYLGGAVLDVTAVEPLPTDNPLWTLPNVLLTQHTGGGQHHEDEGKVDVLLRNLELLQAGQPLQYLVDLSRGY